MKIQLILLAILAGWMAASGCKKQPQPQPQPAEEPAAVQPVTEPQPAQEPDTVPATKVQPTDKAPAAAVPAENATEETAADAANPAALPKAAPLKELTYVKGKPVTFEDGKVYVVEFWATWCGPCRQSIPHLTGLQKQFKDKGVTVIGISSEPVETVRPFVEQMGENMEYTVAADPGRKITAAYMDAFNQRGIPTAFIVNGSGQVAWVGHPLDGMDEVLGQVAAGTFDPVAYAKAKAEFEKQQRRLYELYSSYLKGLYNGQSAETLEPIAGELLSQNDAEMLNALAWSILTEIPQDRRDLKAALKFAEKAVELTESAEPGVLDTLALALFENGRYAEAVKTQTRAMDILREKGIEVPADMQMRLEQFKAKLAETIV